MGGQSGFIDPVDAARAFDGSALARDLQRIDAFGQQVLATRPTPAPLLDLWVPGEPVGKHMKTVVRKGPRGPYASMVNEKETDVWMGVITLLVRAAWHRPMLDEHVVVEIEAVFPRPKGCPDTMPRSAWATGARVRHAVKVDADNVAKGVLDAVTQAGVWKDDGRVCELVVRKFYAAAPEHGPDKPGVRVVIRRPVDLFNPRSSP